MNVTFWQAACQTIEANGLKVLTDPWFGYGDGRGGGNYEGSWGVSVPLPTLHEIIEHIGPVDLIYVSHLHPDHYSPEFLHAYLKRFPAGLVTAEEPLLKRALERDGFERHAGPPQEMCIISNGVDPIDSALALVEEDTAVVHMNDCLWDPKQVAALKKFCARRTITALLPYLGAGEYPQTYTMTPEQYVAEAEKKKRQFRGLWSQYVRAFNPSWAIPIAGDSEYVGPLAELNPLRGLPTAAEAALWEHSGKAMAYGQMLDLVKDRITDRIAPDSWVPADPAPFQGYRYQRELGALDGDRIAAVLPSLTVRAAHVMLGRHTLETPYWLCVGTPARPYVVVDCSGRWGVRPVQHWDEVATLHPREEMAVPARALFGALTGLYSWNLLLGGGHVRCRRIPLEDYRQSLYHDLINHFKV